MAPAAQANSGNSAQPPPNGSRLQLRDVARTLQKRRWLVVVVLAAVTLAGGIFGLVAPKRYSGTALVLVHTSPVGVTWLGTKEQSQPEPVVSVQTQARLVATLQNAGKAAEQLAEAPGGGVHVSAAKIVECTEVDVEEPDILRITVTLADRHAVAAVANTLAKVYVAAARDRKRNIYGDASQVLQKQIEEAQARIEELSDQRLALLQQGGSADVALEVKSSQELISALRTERDSAQQRLASIRRSLGPLRQAAAAESPFEMIPTPRPNPQWATLQEAIDEKQRQLSELRGRYTQEHPSVQNAQEELGDLQARAAGLSPQITEPQYEHNERYDTAQAALRAAEAEAAGLAAQVAAANGSLAQLGRETKDLPRRQVENDKLQQELDIAGEGYRELVATLREHQLLQASSAGIAEVADEAAGPLAVTASLVRTLFFSILLGLFCGGLLALLLEALDTTIRSPDEVARQTGLPLLGAIPLLEDTSPQVVTLNAPQSPASEAFRTLRSNISFALTDLPARSFLVAAALGAEGRSSVAANLAVVTAHAGQTVILADTDLRKPVLAELFGVNPGLGLTNLLVGDATLDEVLQETGVPGLYLLASGPLPPNPAELLDSARMTELLAELHKRADVIIFDSPPALLLADAAILSSKVDRVVLTAEAGRVTVDGVREVLRLMYHARASVLGVVLNKYRVPTAGHYQYYYEEPPNLPRPVAPPPEEPPAS